MTKIIGIIWLVAGIAWFLRPEILRNRVSHRMNRRLKFNALFLLSV